MSNETTYHIMDVKSLYPYVCLNRKYPHGKILEESF